VRVLATLCLQSVCRTYPLAVNLEFSDADQEIRTLLLPLAAATSCAAAWTPASTRTTSSSCCSSSTSATNTPASPTRRSPSQGRQLQGHGRAQGQARHRRPDQQEDHRQPLANANKLSDLPDFNDAEQARQRQGDGGPAHQPHRHLREQGARFLEEPRRGRRHPGRRLRIPDAALRHRERQEQGPVLHPAEVSRIMAKVIGIRDAKTSAATTVYDPTCGSGSLLLKVATRPARAGHALRAGEGRRHRGLARMNMILHDNPRPHRAGQHAGRSQVQGRRHAQDLRLRRRQSAVLRQALEHRPRPAQRPLTSASSPSACRPPSRATTPTCCTSSARSRAPAKARASCRTACCSAAMPRPTSAAQARPQGLHQGHHRPARQPLLRHRHPRLHRRARQGERPARKGIFMIDASKGFMKDGPKNRLRAQDIHKIVDTFTRQARSPALRAHGAVEEIEKNDFNLNLPRYIDSHRARGLAGHRRPPARRHPERDVDALGRYWFAAFIASMNAHFAAWRKKSAKPRSKLKAGCHPKEVIASCPRTCSPTTPTSRSSTLRRLPAPHGLLGRDHAGRLLPDRRRRLEGRDLSHHREGQEGQGEGQGLDLRPGAQGRSSSPATSPRSRQAIDQLRPSWKRHRQARRAGGRARRRGRARSPNSTR
jgi:hypothetical protein